MISKKMNDALNNQVYEEMNSFYLYLAMAEYFQEQKLSGSAGWLRSQAREEMGHAMKFVHYLEEQNSRAVFKALPQPPKEFKSPQAAFELVMKHEQHITASINKLMDLALELKDHATASFLRWFVDEQVEEEASVTKVLDMLEMTAKMPGGMFMVDRELAKRQAK